MIIIHINHILCENRDELTTDNTEQGTESSTRQIERPTDKTQLFDKTYTRTYSHADCI